MINDRDVKILYDSFEKKDMTFEAFRSEMRELTDTDRAIKDAHMMARSKAKARRNAALIDQVRGN